MSKKIPFTKDDYYKALDIKFQVNAEIGGKPSLIDRLRKSLKK